MEGVEGGVGAQPPAVNAPPPILPTSQQPLPILITLAPSTIPISSTLPQVYINPGFAHNEYPGSKEKDEKDFVSPTSSSTNEDDKPLLGLYGGAVAVLVSVLLLTCLCTLYIRWRRVLKPSINYVQVNQDVEDEMQRNGDRYADDDRGQGGDIELAQRETDGKYSGNDTNGNIKNGDAGSNGKDKNGHDASHPAGMEGLEDDMIDDHGHLDDFLKDLKMKDVPVGFSVEL